MNLVNGLLRTAFENKDLLIPFDTVSFVLKERSGGGKLTGIRVVTNQSVYNEKTRTYQNAPYLDASTKDVDIFMHQYTSFLDYKRKKIAGMVSDGSRLNIDELAGDMDLIVPRLRELLEPRIETTLEDYLESEGIEDLNDNATKYHADHCDSSCTAWDAENGCCKFTIGEYLLRSTVSVIKRTEGLEENNMSSVLSSLFGDDETEEVLEGFYEFLNDLFNN